MDRNCPVVIWMRGLTLTVIFLIVLPSARLHLTGVKVGALQGDVHRLTNLIQGDWVIFRWQVESTLERAPSDFKKALSISKWVGN